MSPFLLFPRPGSQLCPLFFVPVVVIKVKGTRDFVFPYLVPVVGMKAKGTTELGKLERGSKGLIVVECPGSTVSPWIGCGEPGSGVSG